MSFARSKAKIYAEDDVKVSFADVAGVDEAEQELREIVEFLKTPEEVHQPRRQDSEGRAAGRPAGHRQDAARPRRRRRSQGAVLQPERLGVRRDVRRRRRRARARSVLAGRSEGAVHRLHRRARRARQGARAEPDGQPRRARADAQPAARGDGRLRRAQGDHHHGARPTGPRCSTRRCCAPAASIGRCWSTSPTSRAARRCCGSTSRNVKLAPDVDLRKVAARTAGFAGADLANLVNEAALLAARRDKTVGGRCTTSTRRSIG